MVFFKDSDGPDNLELVLASKRETKKAEKKITVKIDDEDDIVFVDADKN